jgi:hypothetical protein
VMPSAVACATRIQIIALFSRLRHQEMEQEKGKAKLIPPAVQSGMIYHLALSAQFIYDPVRGRM